jgi:hypothetical protein
MNQARRLVPCFFLTTASTIGAVSAQSLPTSLAVSPGPFQPYTSIGLSVDVNLGTVPICDTEEWSGVDVYGTNGYYGYWYTNYRRESFSFTDEIVPRSYSAITYTAVSFAEGCEEVYGGSDSAEVFPAPPEPIRLRVLFEGYTSDHGACPPGTTSPWYYWRAYQVVDQWNNDYRSPTRLVEQIDNYENSCEVQFLANQPADDPVGEFTDKFAICHAPPCMSGGNCASRSHQYLYANGSYVRGTHQTHTCHAFTLVDVFTP